jgi:large subunit ribosomal protein L24
MLKKQKRNFKVGEKVIIISGFYKNQIGEIKRIDKRTGKIVVKGINLKTKYTRATDKNPIGDMKQIECPIHYSNVKLNINEIL